ncbi:hypothetical protein DFO66_103359 [Brevibacterium sanguinis]|uniref:Uncharacterized protein n=2 Tax=Brevibacterium TaxID=1696 RepID=A0A366IKU8_9MICO|nr:MULTISPECIES: hypothetical protein [Brevibacterium]RBP66412.1 hypothetical protein DFO66_103359 [Brevibacterium sanguinis]RBP73064.1 hypothetical protein DFO65_103359 [Brevibacterium celere]
MNWDEKAQAEGTRRHLPIDRPIMVNELCAAQGIVDGARWQREQLSTDEAVERLARGMYNADMRQSFEGDWIPDFASSDNRQRDEYLARARAGIDALLGES